MNSKAAGHKYQKWPTPQWPICCALRQRINVFSTVSVVSFRFAGFRCSCLYRQGVLSQYGVNDKEWTRYSMEPSKLHPCPRVDCKCEELNSDQGDPLSLVCFIRPWNGEGFVIIIITLFAIWFHAPCNCWKQWPRFTRMSKGKRRAPNTCKSQQISLVTWTHCPPTYENWSKSRMSVPDSS